MQIDIFYSKRNADHLKAVSFVKEAVKNLGISAIINELEVDMPAPRVMVNGFDLVNSIIRRGNGNHGSNGKNGYNLPYSYDLVAQALEKSAWAGI